jgi:hypothetical protein
MANFNCALEAQPCTNNPLALLGYAGGTTPVGLFAPNAWGLRDLHGNVAEWCLDWLGDQLPGGAVEDLQGPPTGILRALRGGSFIDESFACRASERVPADGATARSNAGFRVALMPPRVESYTVTVDAGYTAIANQLDRGSNTLAEVLPVVPNGSHLLKFVNGSYTSNAFQNGWTPPGTRLAPGEGAFLYLPATVTQAIQLTFTGLRRLIPDPPALGSQQFHLISRQIPEPATYEDLTGRAPAEEVQVLRWIPSPVHPAIGAYIIYLYSGGMWVDSGTFDPVPPPIIPRGEAVFVYLP